MEGNTIRANSLIHPPPPNPGEEASPMMIEEPTSLQESSLKRIIEDVLGSLKQQVL